MNYIVSNLMYTSKFKTFIQRQHQYDAPQHPDIVLKTSNYYKPLGRNPVVFAILSGVREANYNRKHPLFKSFSFTST
jgi:hypothetical protein